MSANTAQLRLPFNVNVFLTNFPARISALGLIIASAGFGATYAFQSNQSHGMALASLAVLMAVSLEIAKPLAVARTFDALKSWSIGKAAMLSLLAAVAIGYSLTAELSLITARRIMTGWWTPESSMCMSEVPPRELNLRAQPPGMLVEFCREYRVNFLVAWRSFHENEK